MIYEILPTDWTGPCLARTKRRSGYWRAQRHHLDPLSLHVRAAAAL